MGGEIFGYLMERLMDVALDAWFTPIQMKKNRPAVMVSVLCVPDHEQKVEEILFSETTTLGVRKHTLTRTTLSRAFFEVTTAYGVVRVKSAAGKNAPEYEDCKALAKANGLPLRRIYEAAMVAAMKKEEIL